jgi:DeoR/GlpR family transcriptional regulator of sugar metabolism
MLRPSERRQLILQSIDGLDENMISRLSEQYNVSEMTIRRDLRYLEENGLIKRTYGGAIRWPPASGELPVLDRERREEIAAKRKVNIARYAAEHLVEDGDIIILEGGTTATAMVPYLAQREDLTVVTNGLRTTEELRKHLPLSATILCTGGILRPESSTFVGPATERFLREFHAHRLFLSATGLMPKAGITDPKILETQVKRAMINSASEVIMIMDSSKFGVKSLSNVLAFEEISLFITDSDAPAGMLEELRQRGVRVQIAPDSADELQAELDGRTTSLTIGRA